MALQRFEGVISGGGRCYYWHPVRISDATKDPTKHRTGPARKVYLGPNGAKVQKAWLRRRHHKFMLP